MIQLADSAHGLCPTCAGVGKSWRDWYGFSECEKVVWPVPASLSPFVVDGGRDDPGLMDLLFSIVTDSSYLFLEKQHRL